MAKIRRTPYAFFYVDDEDPADRIALLRGEIPPPPQENRVIAMALLTGERHRLRSDELELLLRVPAESWIDDDGLDPGAVDDLLRKGLLVSDGDAGSGSRERDEALSANRWNLFAALYHYMTRWSGVDIRPENGEHPILGERARAAARAFVSEHGAPPSEFAVPRSTQALALPGTHREGPLYQTLTARRTTRAYDLAAPMTLQQLDTVLRYVFGCHGYARTSLNTVCIKRTSPSAGALHPIEVYPLISNVDGVPPGFYQYGVREHALVPIERLDADEVRATATSFVCGQSYLGCAHVSFVLTARFLRSHWKYRYHQKAYATILMDAGHLSQTLYLVGEELGLGAFVTTAINGRDIEARLGLDGVNEGVVAMTGCGKRLEGVSPLEFHVSATPPAD